MAGMEMLLGAIGLTPAKMKEMFDTFENMKNGVIEFKNAINTLNEKQDAAEKRAQERHAELSELITQLKPYTKPENGEPDNHPVTLES